MINIPRIFELKIGGCIRKDGSEFFYVVPTILRNSTAYQISYHAVTTSLTRFIIPLFIIIFCNVYLLRIICRGTSYRTARQTQQRATSALLVVVGFMFISCNSCSLLATVFELYLDYQTAPQLQFVYSRITDVSNFLTVLNAGCNFMIYLAFNRGFRNLIVEKLMSIRANAT